MIQQSGATPAGIVIDPKPVTAGPDDPEGQYHGFEVIRLASELVRSLSPFYVPDNSLPPGVAAGTDLPNLDNQTSHCQGFTTLAARAIAAYANLPPEIDQALDYLANLLAAGQAASDQLKALTAPAGVVPEPGTDWENAPDETVENAKKNTGKASQHPRQQPDKTTIATGRGSQLPNTSLALGALIGLYAVGASSASDYGKPVNTADELKKICTNETSYPCNEKYRLTRDITIDASQWQPIGSGKRPFRGELNGLNRTIRNLPDCLIENLAGNGKIQNLRLTNANVVSARKAAGIVACRMSGKASVSHILVKHANLVSNSTFASAGIVVGIVNVGTVFNIKASSCTVNATGAEAKVGIGAGLIKEGGTVDKTMAVNCNVSTSYNADAGIGAGENKGIVTNTLASRCHVSTRGDFATVGIGAGKNRGTAKYTTAYKCKVSTDGDFSDAGIGSGANSGTVRYTTAYKCTVFTDGRYSKAGIGAGKSERGDASSKLTVIRDTAAFGCNVSTTKMLSPAGIGAGYIEYQGSIDKTTAVKCKVTTSGTLSNTGIGAGQTGLSNKRGIDNTRVIESTVKSVKNSSNADINGGRKPTVCNATIINGKNITYKTDNCHIDSNTTCEGFDPRLARKNCQEVSEVLFGTNAPPTYPTTEPLTTVPTLNISSLDSHITTTPPTTPPTTSPTTPPTTPPTTTAPSSSSNLPHTSPGSATITTPPTNAPTVTVMTASSSVSARFATPALTESLSPALIAIIATLGAACVVLFAVIGVYTHRNYYRRSSTNAGRNQPMPERPERRLRADRPLPSIPRNDYQLLPVSPVNTSSLPAPPQSHFQLLSGSQGNTSALPAFVQSHYQSLSDNRGNGRTLPQSHYQPLTGRRGNSATGGSNPLAGNHAPPPSDYPAQPVYENIDNYRIPLANGQARTASAGSTMASTGHELTPGQQRPDSPLHPVMTESETDSDHSYDEPAVIALSVKATGGSSHGERW